MTRARKLRASVLAAAAMTLAAGCGLNPGAAAVVGDTRITGEEVDAAAAALCSANIAGAEARGQQAPELPSRGARRGALELMIDSALTHEFAESRGVEVDEQQVSAALEANAAGIAMLPEAQKDDFRSLLRGFTESQDMLTQIGRQALEEQGVESPSDEETLAEGVRLRQRWVKKNAEVEVDPRYGDYVEGALTPDSGSVSIPVSDRATEGQNPDPSGGWVAALPASQKCR